MHPLTCPCNPGKVYANQITFKAHLATKRHAAYDPMRVYTRHFLVN